MSITKINSKNKAQNKDHVEAAFMPALTRLMALVNHQYGCELTYSPLMELTKDNIRTLRDDLSTNAPLYVGDGVYFPIQVRGELMGAARLDDVRDLSQGIVNQLHEVIGLVLESSLLNVLRLDVLQQLEDQLKIIDQSPNVVRFEHFKEVEFYHKSKKKKDFNLNLPVLIEAKSLLEIRKAAMSIYDNSERMAFISINDLLPEVTHTVSGLRSLESVTLFIPEVTCLSHHQQEVICEYLEKFCGPESPQIIAGTRFSLNELKSSNDFSQDLLGQITKGYLNLKDHEEPKVQAEIVDHFIEAMTQDRSPLATPTPQ